MPRRIVICGCSGGGKSTLIEALAAQCFATIPEPGRRIVQAGGPMPWDDPAGFARRAVAVALDDWARSADMPGPVFFDRGLVDAVEALGHVTGIAPPEAQGLGDRYDSRVFLVPPWPDIHVQDAERRHDMRAAIDEYDRLGAAYPAFGYRVSILPKAAVGARVAVIRKALGVRSALQEWPVDGP